MCDGTEQCRSCLDVEYWNDVRNSCTGNANTCGCELCVDFMGWVEQQEAEGDRGILHPGDPEQRF
jgi:hypothetical protein